VGCLVYQLCLPAQFLTLGVSATFDTIVEPAFVFKDFIMICISTDISLRESGWQVLREVFNFFPHCCERQEHFSVIQMFNILLIQTDV
jgi:hypothetical protein